MDEIIKEKSEFLKEKIKQKECFISIPYNLLNQPNDLPP